MQELLPFLLGYKQNDLPPDYIFFVLSSFIYQFDFLE